LSGNPGEMIDPRLAGYQRWEGYDDPFEEQTGPFYFRQEPDGRYRCGFVSETKHLNKSGNVHGGALMSFADFSLFVFALPALRDDSGVTVSLHADFTTSAGSGEFIESTGEIVHESGSMIFVRGKIFSGSRVLTAISGVLKKVRASTGTPV